MFYLLIYCVHAALRYTTTDGQWKESAIRLTNTMVNVHAIINHFGPKIESWTTAHNLSSLTEEQVSFSVVVKLFRVTICLQCFDAVGWAAGRASGLSRGLLVWLSVWSEVQTCI